jgi:hypothetical protein
VLNVFHRVGDDDGFALLEVSVRAAWVVRQTALACSECADLLTSISQNMRSLTTSDVVSWGTSQNGAGSPST